jgi:hypothetical protein
MNPPEALRLGQRVRILSGACQSMCGTVIEVDVRQIDFDVRHVANVALDQPCKYETSEEDFENLQILDQDSK